MPVTMTGGKPRAPLAYGSYEVGRSGKAAHHQPSAAFASGSKKYSLIAESNGDPGAYDPHTQGSFSSSSQSKKGVPFGSTATRKLGMSIYGSGSPGPGSYNVGRTDVPQNTTAFKSGSSQRPTPITRVPGAGTYSPNHHAIHPNLRDSGAAMRGAAHRFHGTEDTNSTEDSVGPGAYDQTSGTLAVEARKSMDKQSKMKIGFGSSSKQRVPLNVQGNPAPGAYEPGESPRHTRSGKRL